MKERGALSSSSAKHMDFGCTLRDTVKKGTARCIDFNDGNVMGHGSWLVCVMSCFDLSKFSLRVCALNSLHEAYDACVAVFCL